MKAMVIAKVYARVGSTSELSNGPRMNEGCVEARADDFPLEAWGHVLGRKLRRIRLRAADGRGAVLARGRHWLQR